MAVFFLSSPSVSSSLNDPQFMSSSPQQGWANCFLVTAVTITLFLASNVLVQKIFGTLISQVFIKLLISGVVAVVGMLLLCLTTSLGRELVTSFQCSGKNTKDRTTAEVIVEGQS